MSEVARRVSLKVLFTAVPRLMAALLRQAIAPHRDIQIVGEVNDASGLQAMLSHEHVDVVVTCSGERDVAQVLGLLLLGPIPIPVLALDPDGRRLGIHDRKVVREVSPGRLVDVIREVVRTRQVTAVESEQ